MNNIIIGQINPIVGDIVGNVEKITRIIDKVEKSNQTPCLIVFPELVLSGYPPEDLLLRSDFRRELESAMAQILAYCHQSTVLLGLPYWQGSVCFNAAAVIQNGAVVQYYKKHQLPNYGVFDERRYFTSGTEPVLFDWQNQVVSVAICEDLWHSETVEHLSNGCDLLVSLNASPFDQSKYHTRLKMISAVARSQSCTVLYCNLVGGQDELLFDGGSFMLNSEEKILYQAPFFAESVQNVAECQVEPHTVLDPIDHLYQALVLGIQDYVRKNHFSGVILGLSGGIDSALTLELCVAALGKDQVTAVMMPHIYTSEMSRQLAQTQARLLQVAMIDLPITSIVDAVSAVLNDKLAQPLSAVTTQNIQARTRGLLLMALSNQQGKLLITTSNKSETAVGYTTLYGDMAGGFAPLKDVLKEQVYALANHCNQNEIRIPPEVITRAPSAELSENQKDSDSLPEYHELDDMLRSFVEQDTTPEHYPASEVNPVIQKVIQNEHKRRQAAPGIKVSEKSFGRERRYPITQGFFRK